MLKEFSILCILFFIKTRKYYVFDTITSTFERDESFYRYPTKREWHHHSGKLHEKKQQNLNEREIFYHQFIFEFERPKSNIYISPDVKEKFENSSCQISKL